jgi:adenine phosphoribosyltransferase
MSEAGKRKSQEDRLDHQGRGALDARDASKRNERILLCSSSAIKLEATAAFFRHKDVVTFDCSACGLAEQPVHNADSGAFIFARERMNYARSNIARFDDFDYIISIENAVLEETCEDKAFVIISGKGVVAKGSSEPIRVPKLMMEKLVKLPLIHNPPGTNGYNTTIGDLLHESNPQIPKKNWVLFVEGKDRKEQITEALKACWESYQELSIENDILLTSYRAYPDFPKPGVLFQDFFPLLKSPMCLQMVIGSLHRMYSLDRLDYIIGMDSRGFCLGTALAFSMRIGFVPIRKAGKLPGPVFRQSYSKEYGTDECEIQKDSLKVGSRVLIIDDLIATGGSMKAAVDLVHHFESVFIVDCCVMSEVPSLRESCQKVMGSQKYTVLHRNI